MTRSEPFVNEPMNPAAGWTPVRRVNLVQEIADQLITGILSGKFKFGERLPPERDLAKYLGVARPTIREAMRILSAIGLLEVRHGEGVFVVDGHSDFVAKAFGWAILLDAPTAREVVETRLAIESELAGLAAKRASPEDVARLEDFLTEMEANLENVEEFSRADLGFHLVLSDAARNLALSRLLHAIQSLLREWIQRSLTHSSVGKTALVQHKHILAAIAAGNEVEARKTMRAHLEDMGEVLIESLNLGPRSSSRSGTITTKE